MARRFGGKDKSKEAPVVDDGTFDPVKALDNAKFQEFLAKHENAGSLDGDPDTADDAELEKRYNAFKECERVSNEFAEFARGEISHFMGVDLEASDLETVKEQVEELAIHDPDAFEEFKEDLRKFKEAPAVIESLEEELAKITDADLEDLKAEHLENTEMLKSLKTIQGHYDSGKLNRAWYSVQRWFSDNPDLEQAFASVKLVPKHLNPDTIRKFIEELTKEVEESGKKIESVEKARKMKEELSVVMSESRNQLLSDISDIKGLSEIVSQRAEAQLEALFKEGSVKSLDIAQEKFAKMDEAGSVETLGMDPLANVDPIEIQEYIDKRLTEKVKSEVRLAIEEVKLGDGAMSKLTKSLESYIDREELGSKTKEETAEFISSVITEVANSLGDSKEAKIKRMLCARILSKIKK